MKYSKHRGFTLIELLAVVTIIGLLTYMAVAAYQGHVRKARRADVKTVLLETVQFLERNYTEANRYDQDSAGTAITLPFSESPLDGSRKYYDVQLVGAPASQTFTIEAVPKNSQEKDTRCATLRIDQAGIKTATGPGGTSECWAR